LCPNLSDSILLGRSTDTKIADVHLHRGYTQRWHPKKIRQKKAMRPACPRTAMAMAATAPPLLPVLELRWCLPPLAPPLPLLSVPPLLFPWRRCPFPSPSAAPSLLCRSSARGVAATRLEDAAPSLLCRSSARGRHRHARDLDLQVLSRLLWKERAGGDLGRRREVAGGEGVRWYLAAWAA
jgi:hypothetical protein